jgi:hypothetical protein
LVGDTVKSVSGIKRFKVFIHKLYLLYNASPPKTLQRTEGVCKLAGDSCTDNSLNFKYAMHSVQLPDTFSCFGIAVKL